VTRDAPTLAAMMNLGDFYRETRRYDRATIAYEHATEIDPSSARAYFNLGQAEESAFDFAAASRDYARALKLAPDDKGIRQAALDLQRRTAQSLTQSPGK
jgi:tetratricopeptide (TPR) repeat protein